MKFQVEEGTKGGGITTRWGLLNTFEYYAHPLHAIFIEGISHQSGARLHMGLWYSSLHNVRDIRPIIGGVKPGACWLEPAGLPTDEWQHPTALKIISRSLAVSIQMTIFGTPSDPVLLIGPMFVWGIERRRWNCYTPSFWCTECFALFTLLIVNSSPFLVTPFATQHPSKIYDVANMKRRGSSPKKILKNKKKD